MQWVAIALALFHSFVLQLVHGRRHAYICSSFVLAATRHALAKRAATECALNESASSLLADPISTTEANGVSAQPSYPPTTPISGGLTRLLDRWMATPSDVWRAIPSSRCYDLVDFRSLVDDHRDIAPRCSEVSYPLAIHPTVIQARRPVGKFAESGDVDLYRWGCDRVTPPRLSADTTA